MPVETELLTDLRKYIGQPSKDTVVANGDDAYVWRSGKTLQAFSTDTFIDDVHFSWGYFSPWQVGARALEASVSDIAAMGGVPTAVFLAMTVPRGFSPDVVREVYRGIEDRAKVHGIEIGGGETTSHKGPFIITVSVLGTLQDERSLSTRSAAEAGDRVYVTGPLGLAAAGLECLQSHVNGYEELKRAHLEPQARVDLITDLAPKVHALIDISDGLSTEIHHICRASECGAMLQESSLLVEDRLQEFEQDAKKPILEYLLHGGEDFELLYTVPDSSTEDLPGYCIGTITADKNVQIERVNGSTEKLAASGYDHQF